MLNGLNQMKGFCVNGVNNVNTDTIQKMQKDWKLIKWRVKQIANVIKFEYILDKI